MAEEKKVDGWKHRRRLIYGTILFSFTVIGKIAFFGGDTAIVQSLVLLDTGVISAYCFSATWDDKK